MSPKHYFLISLCIQIYVKLIFSKEWCVLVVLVQTLGFFFGILLIISFLSKSFALLEHDRVNNVNKLTRKTAIQSGPQMWGVFSLHTDFIKCELAAKLKARAFHIKIRIFTLS